MWKRMIIVLVGLCVVLCADAQSGRQVLPRALDLLPPGVATGKGLIAVATGTGGRQLLPLGLAPGQTPVPLGAPPAGDAGAELRVEFLALLPSPAGGAPALDATLSGLALAAASPDSLTGLEYWSASRGRMRTLYKKAYRVRSKADETRLSDPVTLADLGPGHSWRVYAILEDLTFGTNLYEFEIALGDRWMSVEISNVAQVRYLLLPVAQPGALVTKVEIVPCGEGLLLHLTTMLKAPGFGARRVFESAGNKGLAVLGWFASKAADMGLAAAVEVPRRMEDSLRPGGLP